MQAVLSLVVLTALEIVLGIDNIIFISILCGKLPLHQREFARRLGLGAAMVTRLLLLFSLSWIMSLTAPVFHLTDLGVPERWVTPAAQHQTEGIRETVVEETTPAEVITPGPAHNVNEVNGVSVRDLILLVGGAFLIYSSVKEILAQIRGAENHQAIPEKVTLNGVLVKIAILDIVFSLDSVITAVGLVKELWIMSLAIIIAVGVMMVFAGGVGRFVEENPTIKILALCFLILIGGLLMVESAGVHVPKGYAYTAMAFALTVEMINLRIRKGITSRPATT